MSSGEVIASLATSDVMSPSIVYFPPRSALQTPSSQRSSSVVQSPAAESVRSPVLPPFQVERIRREWLRNFDKAIESVRTDIRDEWASDVLQDYSRNETLSEGSYGRVVAALGRDLTSGFGQSTPRMCVVKTTLLGALFDREAQKSNGDEEILQLKLTSLARRFITDLYIMNRCHHSNLMHSHVARLAAGGDLHVVLPRFYALDSLISEWRRSHHDEHLPLVIIARIVRQLALALDHLHSAGIVHRDIQPSHVFLTRGGTVKLSHFGSARVLASAELQAACRTPVGRFEYMCYEKQHNLNARTLESCLSYDAAADIWSLGILVLAMVSYFPDERWQRLEKSFAVTMHREGMPFKWQISEMMQLRVRLAKCGGNKWDLKGFLSDELLTTDPKRRATAQRILDHDLIKGVCSRTVAEDSAMLAKNLICGLDWPNRHRLEQKRPNYDTLETKAIPSTFYWDTAGTWRLLEAAKFEAIVDVAQRQRMSDHREEREQRSTTFVWSDATQLLGFLVRWNTALDPFDWLPIDHAIRQLACDTMNEGANLEQEKDVELTPTMTHTDRIARIRVTRFAE